MVSAKPLNRSPGASADAAPRAGTCQSSRDQQALHLLEGARADLPSLVTLRSGMVSDVTREPL
jgi:hypothetical protein